MEYILHTKGFQVRMPYDDYIVINKDGKSDRAGYISLEEFNGEYWIEQSLFTTCRGYGMYSKVLLFAAFVLQTPIHSKHRTPEANKSWCRMTGMDLYSGVEVTTAFICV